MPASPGSGRRSGRSAARAPGGKGCATRSAAWGAPVAARCRRRRGRMRHPGAPIGGSPGRAGAMVPSPMSQFARSDSDISPCLSSRSRRACSGGGPVAAEGGAPRTRSRSARPAAGAAVVPPAPVARAIRRTGRRYTADLRTMPAELRAVYAGQIAAKDEALAAQAETIAELRRRAEAAEAELSRRREAQETTPPASAGLQGEEVRGGTRRRPRCVGACAAVRGAVTGGERRRGRPPGSPRTSRELA